jgi:hypothetical protein
LIGIAVARVNSGGSVMSTDVRFFGGIDWASGRQPWRSTCRRLQAEQNLGTHQP